MLRKEYWRTDVGPTELRESSDLSVTSGGPAVGAAAVCTMGDCRPHQARGPHFQRPVSGAPCLHKAILCRRIPSFIGIFLCFGFFFFLKNICCWFSLVLKFCRVEMLTCFHLSVPLSHFFSSQFWCLLQFAYQSDVHIGLDGDLIWSQCCLSAKQMCIKMCIRKRSKLGLLRNFFNLHKLHW